MDTRFAISDYVDAKAVTDKLDNLIRQPIYSITPEALASYEENYFENAMKLYEMIFNGAKVYKCNRKCKNSL